MLIFLKRSFFCLLFAFWIFIFSPFIDAVVFPESLPFDSGPEKRENIVSQPLTEVPGNEEDLIRAATIHARRIIISGITVIPYDDVKKISSSYENREITYEDLTELCHRLTLLYIDRGYINSGVIIPDQKVVNGVIGLKAIEGNLSGIQITGNHKLRSSYIKDRIALGAGPPLNINDLQERLRIMHQDPLVSRIKAELDPGENPGESLLKAHIEETNPFAAGIQLSNNRSPSVGSERMEIYADYMNLSGYGDAIGARYGFTDGLDNLEIYYSFPVTCYGTKVKFFYYKSDSEVIEEQFDDLDIKSELKNYGIILSHPVYKTAARELILSIIGEKRRSETFLLGLPYSFSPGVRDGKSDITVIRLAKDWISREPASVFAVRSVFSLGMDALDATRNSYGPDGEFFSWLMQIQFAGRLEYPEESHVILRLDGQLTRDELLPLEKFSVGGFSSVRGYRENQMVRDNGLCLSFEMRIPVFHFSAAHSRNNQEQGVLQVAPFFDVAKSWNTGGNTHGPEYVSSVGIGIRLNPWQNTLLQVYWGHALKDMNNPDNNIQDAGIHFKIDCRFL